MKPSLSKAILKDCIGRGYVEHNNVWYPPAQAALLNIEKPKKKKRVITLKTGDVDDSRNIRNKAAQKDMFIKLIEQVLSLEVWPEFYFSTDREFRFDYALPGYKIAIEQNGGIWSKGNSGHSSGKGIQRDMDKTALAGSLGWTVISRSPEQMLTEETLNFIRNAIKNKNSV